MTGHRTVRIACVGVLALGLLVVASASSSAAANLFVTVTGPTTNPTAGGGPFEVTVVTKNNDAGDSAAVTTTLSLPSGVTLDLSATPPGSNCSTVVVGTVQCARPVITAGSSDLFNVDFQADHTVSGVVHVLGSSTDGSLTSNTADDPVTVNTSADLAPSISAPAGDQIAGDSAGFDYAVSVTNNGPSDNTGGYTATGTLPAGVSFVSGAGCASAAGGFTCSNSTGLAAGGTDPYTVHVQAASSTAPGSPNAHVGVASVGTNDPTPGNNGADTSPDVSIITQADLQPSISGPSGDQIAGDPAGFDYAVSVKNNGLSDNTGGYTVTGTLPAGVSFVSGAGCASAAGGFTCSNGTGLAAGGTDPYTVHVKVAASACPGTAPSCDGNAHASVSVASGGTTDPTPGNNGAGTSPDVSIVTQADLAPSISAPSGDQIAGDPSGFNYSVSVKNNGLSDNHGGYTVTGTLPPGVSFVSGAGCASAAGGFTCSNSTGLAAGGTAPYTVHVKVAASACPGTAPSCDGTAHASVSVASNGTFDPTSGNDGPAGTSPDVSIITRADLQPSITAPSGNKIAGDSNGFNYTVTVTNNGLSDNHGGYTLTGTLPAYMHWATGGDCSSAASGFTCTNTGGLVAASGSNVDTYHVHVTVDASACPGDPNATPACNGTAHASVSVASNGTTDPTSGNNAAGTSPDVSIITQADLEAQSMTSTASSLFANAAPANATTFTYQFTNNGLSDAQHVVISLPDHPLASANPTYFKIDNLCRVTGTVTCANTGDFGTGTDIGEVDAGATVTVVIHAHANAGLGHNSPDPIATGSFLVKSTATAASRTTDPGPGANVKNVLSPNVTISTVASPPRNPFGIPGTGNTILTWENPAGNGGQTIQNFLITVTPPVGSSFTLPTVPFNAAPTSKCGAVNASDCYQLTVTGLQNDNGAYTFAIQAQNAVGPSDAATTTATPSVNAKNASVPTNTSTTLTTCTTATPTTPVCVVYSIPSGAGGVFGAGGLVALPTGLCGINATCIANTGAQNLGSLAGYTDRTHPLIETITWDSSLIASSYYQGVQACPNNSILTTCYPNNIPIYYEDTFSLLHCGLNVTTPFCDPNTLVDHSAFPVVPGTVLNMHFCAQAAPVGAGNKNYARPKPTPPPPNQPQPIYNGYFDPSGSACIKSMNALGSASQNGANRDIQVVINMTSDSDGLAGRH